MHIAIEQQNMAQLGCAFNADRVLIAKKYLEGFNQSQIITNNFKLFRVLAKPLK
mgnify:CR=1 FL=1